jgi:sugar lactone lactonase YvrE
VKLFLWVVAFLALQSVAFFQARAAAPDDDCGRSAICGLKNPEDAVPLGNARFAIASSYARAPASSSHLYLVDMESKTARMLVPIMGVRSGGAADCPPPPMPISLITHGLSARAEGPDRGRLLVVNHGGRESVEIFAWRVVGGRVDLRWTGCVIVPPGVFSNAVAPLPDGLAVTSFGSPDDPDSAKLIAGRPSGFVTIWTAASGWQRLKGSELPGDNGVEASPDGKTIYVNAWASGALWVLSRNGERPPLRIALGSLHPDNVHRQPDGMLLIAGQVGDASAILNCAQPFCAMPSALLLLDPAKARVVLHAQFPPTANFGAASTALRYRGRYWLTSFRGDRMIATSPDAGTNRFR